MSLLIKSMTNLCLFPHKAELEAFLFNRNRRAKLSPLASLPEMELQLLGAGQESLHKFWIREKACLQSHPHRLFLVGCAGSLDITLPIGTVLVQTRSLRPFHLVHHPVSSLKEAKDLFLQTQKQAVVMESFWSEPESLPTFIETRELIEVRGISDHCEGISIAQIKQSLPALMEPIYNRVCEWILATEKI